MSPAERQQVIDALENSVPKPMDGDDDYCEGGWKRHREALAIMRRNPPKTVEEAWQAATAAERERAAKVCDWRAETQGIRSEAEGNAYAHERFVEAAGCAAAIRKG